MLRPMLMKSFSSFRGRCVRHLGTAVLCVVLLGSSQPSFAASAGRQDAVARQPVYTGQRSAETADRPVAGKSIGMSDAVEHALRFNPGLGAQEAESRSSEEGRKSARGAFGPRLGVSYSATKTESKRDPSASMGTKNPKMGVYSWGVEVTQPIFQGFRLLSTYQKAALQADSDKASLRKAELDMTEQVQTAFLEYLKAGENTRSMRDSLTRLREQLRIAQAYFEVGLSPRLDVLQAEVDVSEAERLLIEAENTQATTLARLNTLLGFDATAVNTYTGTLKEVGFRYTLEQCLELAYRQRPDLYVAQKAVEIARNIAIL